MHARYRRACDPKRKAVRFRCSTCGHTFSDRAFSCTYYMKRPELLERIAAGLVAGSAHRQIARNVGCHHSTVSRLAARLGRHALLLQKTAFDELDEIREPVVIDHFETFVFSQDDRLTIGTAVGQDSWFTYTQEGASHRRAGKRGARKPKPKHDPPERETSPYIGSTRRILLSLLEKAPNGLTVVTDDHPAYRTAVASLSKDYRIQHRVFPNPPRGPGADSEVARERDRQMFPVDLLHRLWRHSDAHHKRETIAFARRSAAALERAAHFMVWRNLVKLVTERRPSTTTPGMRVGVTSRPLSWAEVLSRRLFPNRVRLSESWWKVYRREWTTPAVGRNLRHDRKHAY